jgi:hypothetical protein
MGDKREDKKKGHHRCPFFEDTGLSSGKILTNLPALGFNPDFLSF